MTTSSYYGGLGFGATQEKLFEGAFAQATLAIRLHGTEGIVLSTEARPTGRATLAMYDIERKSLRDCDRVIAPSMPVADHYRSFYGFDFSEWATRIVLHSFPVLVDNAGIAKSCAVSSTRSTSCWSSPHFTFGVSSNSNGV